MSEKHGDILIGEVEQTNKNVKVAILLVAITSTVQIISTAVYYYNDAKDRQEQRIEQALDRRLNALEKQYKRQDQKYKEVEYPMVSYRASMEKIYDVCQKQPLSPQDKEKLSALIDKRDASLVSLVQAYGGSQVVFGEELFLKIQTFVTDAEKAGALPRCSPKASPPITWRIKMNIINEDMYNKFDQTGKAITKAMAAI